VIPLLSTETFIMSKNSILRLKEASCAPRQLRSTEDQWS